MKTLQKLIVKNDRSDFNYEVNRLLINGAKVVPGTLITSVAICNVASYVNSPGATNIKTVESYAVVLEVPIGD